MLYSITSSRLTFKKEDIEPLSFDDRIRNYVRNDDCTYEMSKREFYKVFDNVVNSVSYKIAGNYNYSKTPSKAKQFIVDGIYPENKKKTNLVKRRSRISKEKLSIIQFNDKSNLVEKELAIILGKVSHHIHPKIVKKISESNEAFREEFMKNCHPALIPDVFFFVGSDCVFPGVRRPINKEKDELGSWKNNISNLDGTIFNDNTYPRHLWSFLSTNKAYSGGSTGTWRKSGLDAFELAHIFGHKSDERRLEEMVFKGFDNESRPYSLFTSASNVVLIPKGLTKPTDKMDSIKICFYKRHLDLYGNNMIGLSDFDNSTVPDWYSEIEWIEPVLPYDWEIRINNLLKYRNESLLKKYNPSYIGSFNDDVKSDVSDIVDNHSDINYKEKIKIGELVRSTMPRIIENKLISFSEILKLKTYNYSKEIFEVNYPILKEVESNLSLEENREINGYPRYYSKPVSSNGIKYLITSEWFEKSLDAYINWLRRKEINF